MIFDAHLDLSLNALEYNRDLCSSISEIRELELGMSDLKGRAHNTVSFSAMREADIGICVATQIGGCMRPPGPVASWHSPSQAWAMTQGQLAWYRAMEEVGELRQIRSRDELDHHLRTWQVSQQDERVPIGFLLSLEGSDSIRTLADLETAWGYGLRALGPAHYGVGRYALGHDQSGPLSQAGKDLVREMDQLGLILDVTHLCDETFHDALDIFKGPVWASHHNCRSLVDDPRQLADEQIRRLAERGGVIGVALDAWMMVPDWVRGRSTPESAGVTLELLADHIDHICQLLGNDDHVGIGSDLDGGFGSEQSPSDVDTIADLVNVESILKSRGYCNAGIEKITHRNFVEFTRGALPAS